MNNVFILDYNSLWSGGVRSVPQDRGSNFHPKRW